jgi:hypothetical protein
MYRHVASRSHRRAEAPDYEPVDPEWEEPAISDERRSPSVSGGDAPGEPASAGIVDAGEIDALQAEVRASAHDDLPPVLGAPEGPGVDPLTAPQRALLALFAEHPALRFPGVDHPALETEAQAARALAVAVDRARAAMAMAEKALADRQQELQRLYVQAHEYASIFARDDEALRAALEPITLRATEAPKRKRRSDDEPPKRRGRPPKSEAAELPFAAEG